MSTEMGARVDALFPPGHASPFFSPVVSSLFFCLCSADPPSLSLSVSLSTFSHDPPCIALDSLSRSISFSLCRPFGSALLVHVVAALEQMETGEDLEAVAHPPDVSDGVVRTAPFP